MSQTMVLCYHALSSSWDADLSLPPDEFHRQLEFLTRRGWRAVTFTEAATTAASGKRLAITFDDAFLSVLELAAPALASLDLVATVFAPTSFMEARTRLRWPGVDHWLETEHAGELECMDWEDLASLQSRGWEIGSHTRSHPRLTQLDDSALRAELERSREEIVARLGGCTSIAYPYGDLDARVARFSRETGYQCGAALSSSLRLKDAWSHPRLGIYRADSGARFKLKANRVTRLLRASRYWPEHE